MFKPVAFLSAAVLAGGGGLAVTAVTADVALAAPFHSQNEFSDVVNVAGDDVKIKAVDPDTDEVYYRYISEGDSTYPEDRDVRGFRSRHDDRCVRWMGAGLADGWYKLHGNTWVPIRYNFVVVKVAPWGKKCRGKKWIDDLL